MIEIHLGSHLFPLFLILDLKIALANNGNFNKNNKCLNLKIQYRKTILKHHLRQVFLIEKLDTKLYCDKSKFLYNKIIRYV